MRLGAAVFVAVVAVAGLAYIAPMVWRAYLQKYGVFTAEQEAATVCGKTNVAVLVHSDEEPMRNWITAKISGNANTADLDRLRQDLSKRLLWCLPEL
jgi:hypothetical protein